LLWSPLFLFFSFLPPPAKSPLSWHAHYQCLSTSGARVPSPLSLPSHFFSFSTLLITSRTRLIGHDPSIYEAANEPTGFLFLSFFPILSSLFRLSSLFDSSMSEFWLCFFFGIEEHRFFVLCSCRVWLPSRFLIFFSSPSSFPLFGSFVGNSRDSIRSFAD